MSRLDNRSLNSRRHPLLHWMLLLACTAILTIAIATTLVTHYTFYEQNQTQVVLKRISSFAVTPSFYVLVLAPVLLVPSLLWELPERNRRRLKVGLYLGLIGVSLAFHPVAQLVPGIDGAYVKRMLSRAERLNLIGKPQEEVIALLGAPDYILPVEGSSDEVQTTLSTLVSHSLGDRVLCRGQERSSRIASDRLGLTRSARSRG